MPSFNRVILIGHLTRDVQLRLTPQQKAVAEFGIAMNRKFGDGKEEVTFVDVTAWDKTAEFVAKFFRKGKAILIEGRLKYDTWEDKQGGWKRSKLSVVADRCEFAGGPKEDGGQGPTENDALRAHFKSKPAPTDPREAEVFTDESIPF